jgi:hypothetical protein
MQKQQTTKTTDDLERERRFTPRSFTFEEYDQAVCDQKEHLRQVWKQEEPDWSSYDAKHYADPFAVQLACIYDMLRHLMAKSGATIHDVQAAAYIELHWDAAVNEAPAWRLGKKRKYTEEDLLQSR